MRMDKWEDKPDSDARKPLYTDTAFKTPLPVLSLDIFVLKFPFWTSVKRHT